MRASEKTGRQEMMGSTGVTRRVHQGGKRQNQRMAPLVVSGLVAGNGVMGKARCGLDDQGQAGGTDQNHPTRLSSDAYSTA